MLDFIVTIWAWVIAITICSMVIVPLLSLCYTCTKIKMIELKERNNL